MRLLNDLMFGLGEARGVLAGAFGDLSPLSGQNDGFSPMTCGCAACAGKVDYTPTLIASEQFQGNFTSLWTFQADAGLFQSVTPNDGPQEVNESGGDIIEGSVETSFSLTLGQSETGTINTENDRDWMRSRW